MRKRTLGYKYFLIFTQLLLILVSSIDFAISDPTSQIIPASEILDRIKSGQPVEYEHVTVIGDLDLNHLDLSIVNRTSEIKSLGQSKKAITINSSIRLNDSLIEGNVYLNNTIFEKDVNFNATKFNRSVYFLQSRFNGPSFFWASEFDEPTYFEGSKFSGPTYFRYSKFNESADFRHSEFSGFAEFSCLNSNEFVNFAQAEFDGPVDFSWSKFDSIDYSYAKFNGLAIFWRTMFTGAAYFIAVKFNGEAYFLDSGFSEIADFRDSKFNSTANFENATFFDVLDLTSVTFGSHLYIYWPSVARLSCNSGATYLALIKNCRELEQYEAADDIYYKYRDWRRDRNTGWPKMLDDFAWLSCGYGIKPERTVFFTLIALFFFGLIYFLKYWLDGSKNLRSLKESFTFSAVALFSLPKELYPYGRRKYMKLVRWSIGWGIFKIPFRLLVFFERIIGWGILLLFITTLTRVMIRY